MVDPFGAGPSEVASFEVDPFEVDPFEDDPSEVDPSEVDPSEVDPFVGVGQIVEDGLSLLKLGVF